MEKEGHLPGDGAADAVGKAEGDHCHDLPIRADKPTDAAVILFDGIQGNLHPSAVLLIFHPSVLSF